MNGSPGRNHEDLVRVAGELAERFAGRAARHDRENTFPAENYDDLRDAGFLGLTVPGELGGLDARLSKLVAVLERLAAADGSTALAYAMHASPLGQWASVWRRTGNPELAEMLTMAAEGRLVWASVTSEPGMRNDLTDATTRARRVVGGFQLSGRKAYATNTAVATHCSTTARFEDAEGGPRLLLCRIALNQPGITVEQTWDTLGMRATQSNDVVLEEVFVADEDVVHALPVGHLDRLVFETVWSWAMPVFASVYTGIASGAVDWTVAQLGARGRGVDPLVQDTIGECVMLVETARALIERHAREVESRRLFELGVQDGIARCAMVKHVATEHAARVMHRLVDVLGGASFTRRLPFERMWRDVQAGRFMPMPNPAARVLLGASVLRVAIAPVSDTARPRADRSPDSGVSTQERVDPLVDEAGRSGSVRREG